MIGPDECHAKTDRNFPIAKCSSAIIISREFTEILAEFLGRDPAAPRSSVALPTRLIERQAVRGIR